MSEICTMQILIVSATAMEVAHIRAQKPNLPYLVTGVGAPSCMYNLLDHLQHNRCDAVIQVGIAGCFDKNVALSTVFAINQDVFADLGIYENGKLSTLFAEGFADPNQLPHKNGWLVNETRLLQQVDLPVAKAITVNTVSDKEETTLLYQKKFQATIESMEGAAFHFVCLQKGIPFLQLRSVSNWVGERNKSKWQMKESILSLNETLLKIVDSLK